MINLGSWDQGSFLGNLRRSLPYVMEWLPRASIKPSHVQPGSQGTVLANSQNGPAWSFPYSGMLAYASRTSDYTTASLTTGSYENVISVTFTGDGVSYYKATGYGSGMYASAAAAFTGITQYALRDGSTRIAAYRCQRVAAATANDNMGGGMPTAIIAPFTGSKTIYLAVRNSMGGASTLVVEGGSEYPIWLSIEPVYRP